MKRIFTGLLVLVIMLSAVGCRKSLGEMAGEALFEGIFKSAGVDVDIEDEGLEIKGKDGEVVKIGNTDWPKNKLAKNIPEFKKGKINSVVESDEYVYIMIEDVSEKDFKNYLDDIKKKFDKEPYEINSEDTITYTAKDGNGLSIMLSYYGESGFTITLAQQES